MKIKLFALILLAAPIVLTSFTTNNSVDQFVERGFDIFVTIPDFPNVGGLSYATIEVTNTDFVTVYKTVYSPTAIKGSAGHPLSVYLYPDEASCKFHANLNYNGAVNVNVKIYSQSGTLLYSKTESVSPMSIDGFGPSESAHITFSGSWGPGIG